MASSGAQGGSLTGERPRNPAGQPLDASMALLREVMEHPLDPEYATAAAHPRRRSPRYLTITVLLAIVGGMALTFAVQGLRGPASITADNSTRLLTEIDRRSERAKAQRRENDELNAQIAAAQARLLKNRADTLVSDVARLSALTGESPVRGPGVQLTMDDAPSADESPVGQDPRENETDDGRVLDRDLQIVVNGLWAAGAEAIAVNGQRLTSLSAIRSAGLAILVDFRPLVRPYVIRAIGDPSALQSGFAADMAGPYLQSLRDNYGMSASLQTQSAMTLPGAGSRLLRVATVTSPPTPTPAPTATASGTGTARPPSTTPSESP